MYTPDRWVIIKLQGEDPHYRVFGTWYGGYLSGDSWRLNSGIKRAEQVDDCYLFHGSTGSVYQCAIGSYGTSAWSYGVLQGLIEGAEIPVEILDEDTDWPNLDY